MQYIICLYSHIINLLNFPSHSLGETITPTSFPNLTNLVHLGSSVLLETIALHNTFLVLSETVGLPRQNMRGSIRLK